MVRVVVAVGAGKGYEDAVKKMLQGERAGLLIDTNSPTERLLEYMGKIAKHELFVCTPGQLNNTSTSS
jgi:hypothetical protein